MSPHGSYFGAALAGVDEREAGLASGLNNTTFQIGAAIGTAIVSTVAVSRTDELLAAGGDRLVALTEGFQSAFPACIVLAGIGLLLALMLPGPAPPPALEVAPEPLPAAVPFGSRLLSARVTPTRPLQVASCAASRSNEEFQPVSACPEPSG